LGQTKRNEQVFFSFWNDKIIFTMKTLSKALQKMEISKFFFFVSFRIARLPKFGNFLEKRGFSKFAKILQKKFGNKFRSKTPVFEAKTGVSKHYKFTEYSEFVLFQIFKKLQKMT